MAEQERSGKEIVPVHTAKDGEGGDGKALVVGGSIGQIRVGPRMPGDTVSFEEKLRKITEEVPAKVSNVSGSSAGAGSGDFHQARPNCPKNRSGSHVVTLSVASLTSTSSVTFYWPQNSGGRTEELCIASNCVEVAKLILFSLTPPTTDRVVCMSCFSRLSFCPSAAYPLATNSYYTI